MGGERLSTNKHQRRHTIFNGGVTEGGAKEVERSDPPHRREKGKREEPHSVVYLVAIGEGGA